MIVSKCGRLCKDDSINEILDDTVIITNLRVLCEFCEDWLTFYSKSAKRMKEITLLDFFEYFSKSA